MAKLSRESRLRERRLEKKARKDRRKEAALDGSGVDEFGAPLAAVDHLGNPLPMVDEFGNPLPDEEQVTSDTESPAGSTSSLPQ